MGGLKKILLFVIAGCLLVVAGSWYLDVRHKRQMNNQAISLKPDNRERTAVLPGAAIDELHGFIVWSTNRYGNHELAEMTLPDRKIVRLTRNPLQDTFPRISPDGNRLVFTRSQKPNVSQRNSLLWDIYLYDLRSGGEKLLAKNGYAPSWSDRGDAVYFLRNGDSIWRYDTATGQSAMVFKSGKTVHVPLGVTLGMPSWNDNNRAMAVTFREGLDGTGIIKSNGDVALLGGGCQIQWSPDGSWLYYVDHDWRQNTIFNRIDLKTKEKSLLFDSPTRFSHEYFPKLDRTGKYLVFGASTGGHELDQADYEIFLWRVASPFSSAVRLTFNPANDCWPDLYLKE